MKWIKYQIVQCTLEEEDVLITKKVGYDEAHLAIAQQEAYNGQYEIIEDNFSLPEASPVIVCGTTVVADGAASPYPEGTLYVVIE